jgi:hypothetical protein
MFSRLEKKRIPQQVTVKYIKRAAILQYIPSKQRKREKPLHLIQIPNLPFKPSLSKQDISSQLKGSNKAQSIKTRRACQGYRVSLE